MTRKGKWLALTVTAATVAAACEQSPTSVPSAEDFQLAALVGPMPPGAGYEVTVCKEGPAGTYNFTASTTTPGGTTLDQGAAFTLTAGDATMECKRVASTAVSLQNVTVTEVAPYPANTTFLELARYRFTTSNNTLAMVDVIQDPATTVQFGNDVGWVLIYRNTLLPSTGCTLTQGYWKTHSEKGPAPYDDTWALLANGADTPFFGGASWYDVFHTPVGGNQYYNLAHQYMAAYLNTLAGASAPQAVLDALSDAETLFGLYSPADIAGLKGNDSLRKQFVELAGTLGSYNEGLTGPGHCGD